MEQASVQSCCNLLFEVLMLGPQPFNLGVVLNVKRATLKRQCAQQAWSWKNAGMASVDFLGQLDIIRLLVPFQSGDTLPYEY